MRPVILVSKKVIIRSEIQLTYVDRKFAPGSILPSSSVNEMAN